MCRPKLHFASLPSCLIPCVFLRGADVWIGRETAGICIWLCVTSLWSAASLSAAFWQTLVLLPTGEALILKPFPGRSGLSRPHLHFQRLFRDAYLCLHIAQGYSILVRRPPSSWIGGMTGAGSRRRRSRVLPGLRSWARGQELLKKMPTAIGRLPKQIKCSSMALKHLSHLM